MRNSLSQKTLKKYKQPIRSDWAVTNASELNKGSLREVGRRISKMRLCLLILFSLVGSASHAASSGPRYWAPLQIGKNDATHLLASAERCKGPEDFLDADEEDKFAEVVDCMERSGYGLFQVLSDQKTVSFLSYVPEGINPRLRFSWELEKGFDTWGSSRKGYKRTGRDTRRKNGEFGCTVHPRFSSAPSENGFVFSGDNRRETLSKRDCGSMRW